MYTYFCDKPTVNEWINKSYCSSQVSLTSQHMSLIFMVNVQYVMQENHASCQKPLSNVGSKPPCKLNYFLQNALLLGLFHFLYFLL